MKRQLIFILWPSFVMAGIGNGLFFTVFDPVDFTLFGPFGLSRLTAYSAGFLILWLIAAASSAFTCFLQRTERQHADR